MQTICIGIMASAAALHDRGDHICIPLVISDVAHIVNLSLDVVRQIRGWRTCHEHSQSVG